MTTVEQHQALITSKKKQFERSVLWETNTSINYSEVSLTINCFSETLSKREALGFMTKSYNLPQPLCLNGQNNSTALLPVRPTTDASKITDELSLRP